MKRTRISTLSQCKRIRVNVALVRGGCIKATFTRIRLHCESVLIRVCLILTFTLSHLNEYPKRTDLKTTTKAYTYRNDVFVQACKRVYRYVYFRPLAAMFSLSS